MCKIATKFEKKEINNKYFCKKGFFSLKNLNFAKII